MLLTAMLLMNNRKASTRAAEHEQYLTIETGHSIVVLAEKAYAILGR